MRTLKHYLVISMVYLLAVTFAVQAPFLNSHNNYPPTNGFTQPSCTDFTRWVQNPLQNQNNDNVCPGLGLIPAPVDLSIVARTNPIGIRQSKIVVTGIGNRHFEMI